MIIKNVKFLKIIRNKPIKTEDYETDYELGIFTDPMETPILDDYITVIYDNLLQQIKYANANGGIPVLYQDLRETFDRIIEEDMENPEGKKHTLDEIEYEGFIENLYDKLDEKCPPYSIGKMVNIKVKGNYIYGDFVVLKTNTGHLNVAKIFKDNLCLIMYPAIVGSVYVDKGNEYFITERIDHILCEIDANNCLFRGFSIKGEHK